MKKLILVTVTLFTLFSQARPKNISLSWDYNIFTSRWMFEERSQKKQPKGVVRQLYFIKKHAHKKEYKKCLTKISKTKVSKSLRPWLAFQSMECALGIKKNKKRELVKVKRHIDKNSKWLFEDAYAPLIKKDYYKILYKIFQIEADKNNDVAWRYYDQIVKHLNQYSNVEKAKIYKWASDLAFVRQNFELAVKNILRSLKYKENSKLRSKLKSLKNY